MSRTLIVSLPVALLTLCVVSLAGTTTINSTDKYAYSANGGWINFRADATNGAVIGEYICSNYLYSANMGWIHLGNGSPTNGYEYSNSSADDYGVNHDGEGNLTGYAYGANVGWISFETNGAPKVDLKTGVLSGYAYGANVGWISLSNSQAYVKTDSLDTGPDSDADGIPDAWEMSQAGSLTNLSAGSDADGDGVLDVDEYAAETEPLNSNEYFRITSVIMTDTNVQIEWTSEETRMYKINRAEQITNSSGWVDSELGAQAPDAGATTTRAITNSVSTKQYYRVRAYLPLSE